ncbi:PR domain zinc finger protein 2-like [Anneissia japonica]|uniref:PR domain zinc finger protein 2-like n=1 Tax=Anneissia japonica TaxID=1529436 RepID=UPI0014255326|nr:PR domain zinc finger protein 2-like [Anneissia japonica]XP_033104610.1 PR domain zinc finger protein 2-like [Anneissia japonica]
MEEAMPEGMFLPRELELRPSQTDDNRIGIYSKYTIKKGVKYGPFKGVRKKIEDVVNYTYSWEIVSPSRKPICVIDASDITKANWLRFVKSARFYEEQNMIATQLKRNIFYKVIKDIYPGDELLCWFNNSGDVSCNWLDGGNRSKETDATLNKNSIKELKDIKEYTQSPELEGKTSDVKSLSHVPRKYNKSSNAKLKKRMMVDREINNKKLKKQMKTERDLMEVNSNLLNENEDSSSSLARICGSIQISNVVSLADCRDHEGTSEAESTREFIAGLHDSTMPTLKKLQITKDDSDLPDTSLQLQLSPPLLSPVVKDQLNDQGMFDNKTNVDLNIQTPDVSSTNDVKQTVPVPNKNVDVFQIGPEDQIRDKRGRPFYKCKVCGGIFSKQVGLKIHYRKNHSAQKHHVYKKPIKIAHPREKIRTRSVSVTEVVTKRKRAIGLWDKQNQTLQGDNEATQQEVFDLSSDLEAGTEMKTTNNEITVFRRSATFTCPYCDKLFRYPGWLERHVLQHNVPSSKQISCPDCSRKFLSYSHFRAHLPLHGKSVRKKMKKIPAPKNNPHNTVDKQLGRSFEGHRSQPRTKPRTNKLKKLRCEVCGKKFHSPSNCIRHRRLVHNIRIKRRRKANGQQDYFIDKNPISSVAKESQNRDGPSSKSGQAQSMQTITAIPEDTPSIAAIFGLASSDVPSSSEGEQRSEIFSTENQSEHWIDEDVTCPETMETHNNAKTHHTLCNALSDAHGLQHLRGNIDTLKEETKESVCQDVQLQIQTTNPLPHENVPSGSSCDRVISARSIHSLTDYNSQETPNIDQNNKETDSNETFKFTTEGSCLRNYLSRSNLSEESNKTRPAEKTALWQQTCEPARSNVLQRVLSSNCKLHGHMTTSKKVVTSSQTRFYNAVAASPWSQVSIPQPYVPRKKNDTLSQPDSQVLNLAVKNRKRTSEMVLDLTTQQSLIRPSNPDRPRCLVHPKGISQQSMPFRANHPREEKRKLPPPYTATPFSQRMSTSPLRQQQTLVGQSKHGVRQLSPSAKVIFPGMNPDEVHPLNSSVSKIASNVLPSDDASHRHAHSNFHTSVQHGVQPQYHYSGTTSIPNPSNIPIDLITNKLYGNVRQSAPEIRPKSHMTSSPPPMPAQNQSINCFQSPRVAHQSVVVPMVPNMHLPHEMPKNSQPKTVKEILEVRAASKKNARDILQNEPAFVKTHNPQFRTPVCISSHPDQSPSSQSISNVFENQPQNLSMASFADNQAKLSSTPSENFKKQTQSLTLFGDTPTKTISTFKCNVCEAPFNSMKDLTQHVIIHAEDYNYKCEFCIRLFKDPKDLVEHRSTLHRVGKMYACSVCQREFAYLSNLQTHQRDCHANAQCTYTELGPDELRPINFTVPVQAMPPNRDHQFVPKSRISQISDDMKKNSPSKFRNTSPMMSHSKQLANSQTLKNQSPRKSAPVNPQRHHPFAHHRKLGFLNMMTNQRYETVRHDTMNTCTKCSLVFLDKLEFHKHIMECATVTTPLQNSKRMPVGHNYKKVSGYEEVKQQSAMPTDLKADEEMRQMKSISKQYDPNKHARRKSLPEVNDIHKCFGCGKLFSVVAWLERHKKKCPNQEKILEVSDTASEVTPSSCSQQNLLKEQHACPFCKRNFCYLKSLKKHALICPQRVDEGIDPLQLIEDAQRKLQETKLKEVSFRKSMHNPFNKVFKVGSGQGVVQADKSSTPETSPITCKIRIKKRMNYGQKTDYVIDNDDKAPTICVTDTTIGETDEPNPDKSHAHDAVDMTLEATHAEALECENDKVEAVIPEFDTHVESEIEETSNCLVMDLQ